ncbi:MAG TPA: right-handed parallel beta-helix repeat-containing protein [Polyangiales bacterium]|nr:right-handed parallel beta-helix repeat-containing protein [Polyangiales bacterium]
MTLHPWLCCAALMAGGCGGLAQADASSARADERVTCTATSVTELRVCLDSLGDQGGRVALKAGRYVLSRHVQIRYGGIDVIGEGAGKTVLQLEEGACQAAIVIGSLALEPGAVPPVQNVSIRGLAIDGNKSGNACCERYTDPALAHLYVNGISVFNARNVTIEDVTIENARSGGIVTDRGVYELAVRGVTIRGSAWDGIALYQTHQSRISDSLLQDNAAAGISLDWHADGNVFTHNLILDNGAGETGLHTQRCAAIDRARASPGIFSAGCSDNVFVDNAIVGSGGNGVQLGLGSDKRSGSSRNYLGDNVIRDSAEFGVWVVGDASLDNLAVGTRNARNRLGPILFTDTHGPPAEHYLDLVGDRE